MSISQRVELSVAGFSNICPEFLQNDFSFHVGKDIYRCSKIYADFISPAVSKLHIQDPTTDSFHINVDDPKKLFQFFMNIKKEGHLLVKIKDLEFYLHVSNLLGNKELISKLAPHHNPTGRFNEGNVVEELLFYDAFGLDNEELIEFSASHFMMLFDSFEDTLPLHILEQILGSSSLMLSKESILLHFIIKLIELHGEEFRQLLEYVQIPYLSSEDISLFLNKIDVEDVSVSLWSQITSCLIYGRIEKPDTDRYRVGTKYFAPKESHEFEGIFNWMNKKCGGNCAVLDIISVVPSGTAYIGKVSNIFDYSDFSGDSGWYLENKKNGYLQVIFHSEKVRLTHYSMHTSSSAGENDSYPRSWSVEASNDLRKWIVLDTRVDDPFLNGPNMYHVYPCSNPCSDMFSYFRICQQGRSYCSHPNYEFYITGLEFFGEIDLNDK